MSPVFRLALPAALLAGLLLTPAAAQPAASRFNGATPVEWSVKLADSEMARRGDRHFHGGSHPRARIDYTTAFFGTALVKLAERTGRPAYADYGLKFAESFIAADGSIHTYQG